MGTTMNLSEVIASSQSANFCGNLKTFLQQNEELIPVEFVCERGGIPEAVTVYDAEKLKESAHSIYAKVSVSLTEEVGAGGGGGSTTFSRDMTCHVTIDKRIGTIMVKPDDAPAEPEF
jgi:hypothetical protein